MMQAMAVVHWKNHNAGPIGIDIGANCVRAIQFRRRGSACEVVAARRLAFDPHVPDSADLRLKLAQLLAERRFLGKKVTTCLPSADVEVKTIRLPNMPTADLFAAAEFEARERFPDLAKDHVIRGVRAGAVGQGAEPQQEVIVLAARDTAIDARLELLTGLGLIVESIEPGPHAFFRPFERYLRRASDAQRSSAFLDFGSRGSRIVITRGCEIVFIKHCPIGGETLDKLIHDHQSMAHPTTDRSRPAEGAGDESAPKDEEMEAAFPALDQLGKEIALCLRYYAVTFRGERPEQVTCGGAVVARLAVRARLAQAAQLPVELGHALRDIEHSGALDEPDQQGGTAEWTTAVGLALHQGRSAKVEAKVA
jgi:Tfp pilus assembly PilM family ATPase